MVFLRRYLALAALFFWQGGFTFYAAVVVPVGQEEFGHLKQGFITRRVTFYLNLSGIAALLLLAGDLLASCDPSLRRRLARGGLWLVMLLILVGLFFLHPQLDQLLVRKGFLNTDPEAFRPLHRLYLWISTAQWAAALLYLALTLRAWRAEDRGPERATQARDHRQEECRTACNSPIG
jgi:hypothetical protein